MILTPLDYSILFSACEEIFLKIFLYFGKLLENFSPRFLLRIKCIVSKKTEIENVYFSLLKMNVI